jgi:hypothetical protein
MNAKPDFILPFDPAAWERSVVTHNQCAWLPSALRSRQAVNLRVRQTRVARNLAPFCYCVVN